MCASLDLLYILFMGSKHCEFFEEQVRNKIKCKIEHENKPVISQSVINDVN